MLETGGACSRLEKKKGKVLTNMLRQLEVGGPLESFGLVLVLCLGLLLLFVCFYSLDFQNETGLFYIGSTINREAAKT